MVAFLELSQSTVVIVGAHEYAVRVAERLVGRGLAKLIFVDADAAAIGRAQGSLLALNPAVAVAQHVAEPLQLVAAEPQLFTSANLVIALDQPRPIEEALGTLLWQPDVPLLISRKVAFNAKMRAQYRTWNGRNGTTFHGANLDGPPKDEWTDAKGELLREVVRKRSAAHWPAHCLAGLAIGDTLRATQPAPSPNDPAALASSDSQEVARAKLAERLAAAACQADKHEAADALELMLSGGYDRSPVTTECMAALLAWDAEALVAGATCPLNSCTIEQAWAAGVQALAP